MKPRDILQAMNDVDTDLLEVPAKNKNWIGWAAAAAACLAVILAAFLWKPPVTGQNTPTTTPVHLGGLDRNYVNGVQVENRYLVFPWEYKTVWEQYTALTLNGIPYHSRARRISEEKLGEDLGRWTAKGYDMYTEAEPERTVQVRAITGVNKARLVAVELDGNWYVFLREDAQMPPTFGAFMDELNLAENMKLNLFSSDESYYSLESDSQIWRIFSACRDAQQMENSDFLTDREHITFTANSEEIGISNLVFTVTADGFVKTNILNFGCNYFIGEGAARQIIDYAMAHKRAAKWQADYWLAGHVTQISEGYLLLDDSVMMEEADEGMVFRVSTADIRIRRWLEFGGMEKGDFVVVRYLGGVDTENGNTVLDAYAISEARLVEGAVLIPS